MSRFIAADNPHANRLTVHILAAVAQHERTTTCERTKAALAVAKRRASIGRALAARGIKTARGGDRSDIQVAAILWR
jgi:DNA invertase Pin-like site-specific DNA recombinase